MQVISGCQNESWDATHNQYIPGSPTCTWKQATKDRYVPSPWIDVDVTVCLPSSNEGHQACGDSQAAYGALNTGQGIIEGHVTDVTVSPPQPVANAPITVSGVPFSFLTDANGFYYTGFYAGTYTVSGPEGYSTDTPMPVTVDDTHSDIVVDFTNKPEPSRIFTVLDASVSERSGGSQPWKVDAPDSIEGARPGDFVGFEGRDWNPKGSSINVVLNNKGISGYPIPAETSFGTGDPSYRLPATMFAFHQSTCYDSMTATQDSVQRMVKLQGEAREQVLFRAGNVTAPVTGLVQTGDVYCQGEPNFYPFGLNLTGYSLPSAWRDGGATPIWVHPGDVLVAQLLKNTVENPASPSGDSGTLRIFNEQAHVNIPWGVLVQPNQRLVMGLAGGQTTSIVGNAQSPTINIAEFNPLTTGRAGVQTLAPQLQHPRLTGYDYSPGSLTITGGLDLAFGLLYVNGDLTISGGVTGRGAILATGSITIRGATQFSADDVTALACGGTMSLLGG
jgi:hypothetical protein